MDSKCDICGSQMKLLFHFYSCDKCDGIDEEDTNPDFSITSNIPDDMFNYYDYGLWNKDD